MNRNPFAWKCRRLLCKAGLSLAMLLSVLALCGLLMGCACRPSIDPVQLKQLLEPHPFQSLQPWVGAIGINCCWRY